MKKIVAFCVATFWCSHPAVAQSWLCEPSTGYRVDYQVESSAFLMNADSISTQQTEIILENGKIELRLLPNALGKSKGLSPEKYSTKVILISEDMITFSLDFGGGVEKVDIYTLFPKREVGFLMSSDSYLGSPLMKDLSDVRPDIPEASAKLFYFRCKEFAHATDRLQGKAHK